MFLLFLSLAFQVGATGPQATELDTIKVSSGEGYSSTERENANQKIKSSYLFTDVLEEQRGVDIQTSCAFCGSKRLSINGLKGEHTTLLVDDVQLFSSISSFYSLDAISPLFIEDIDVYRGPGASGYRAEAIAGVVNIRTKEPFKNQNLFNLKLSEPQKISGGLLLERRLSDNHAAFIGADLFSQLATDVDKNLVTEVPYLDRFSVMYKSAHQLSSRFNLSLRGSHSELAVVGGNPDKVTFSKAFLSAEQADFQEGDVRKNFVGNPRSITDNNKLRRTEVVVKGEYQFDDESVLNWSFARADQNQKTIYSHGFDYQLKDTLSLSEVNWNSQVTSDLNLKLGGLLKSQKLDSDSEQLYQVLNLTPDSFNAQTVGAYSQILWQWQENVLITAALRVEDSAIDWTHFKRSLAEKLLAPRLMAEWRHNDQWRSTWSWGRGYRMPLSLFESQHGTTEHGFDIALTKPELSQTISYGIAANRENDFFEFNIFHTELENMAYGKEPAIANDPLEYVNSEEVYQIWLLDSSFGSRLNQEWSWEIIGEAFLLPTAYKNKLPVAALERRLKLAIENQQPGWKYRGQVQYFPGQNLSDFGYDKHYNRISGVFPDPEVGSEPKRQRSPDYYLVSAEVRRFVSPQFEMGLTIENLLNFTQFSVGDGPLVWAKHGEHYHLDNKHLWGPLRGREISMDLKYYF